jgi:PAS domain S-box-containing protein
MATVLRVLLLEDRESDALLVLHELGRAGYDPVWARVETEPDFLAHLDPSPDIILSDYQMPQFGALQAFRLLQERGLEIPFIVVSGTIGEDVAVEAMKLGVTDYILKDRLGRLGQAVQQALEKHRMREDHKRTSKRLAAEHAITTTLAEFTSLEEAVPRIIQVICETLAWAIGTVWKVDPDGQVLRCLEIYQAAPDKAKEFEAITRQMTFAPGVCLPGRIWTSGKPCWITDVTKDANCPRAPVAAKEGLHGALGFPILSGEQVLGVIECFSHEIQVPDEEILSMMASVGSQIGQAIERKRIDEELRGSEERYRQIVETAIEGIWTIDAKGETTFVNERLAHMLGYTAEEMIGRPLLNILHERDRGQALERLERIRKGAADHFDMVLHRKDGTELASMVSAAPFLDKEGRFAGALAMITDISERKQLEEQFRQAQKMEAFGQLAGGVAHDFNNLLTVISGYSELLLSTAGLDDSTKNLITQIHMAGERAASLTRQLLAFSRKQVLEPKVLDLNTIIIDTEKMLRRLIGEDVTLTSVLQSDLARVKVDPGQMDQVIMNLAVNARDAMPQGGKLTIETTNVDLDQAYAETHPEVTPGRYVMMAVSDTGCGMDDATKARIFEPFFTTKGPGKGTGLGLATAFGIVKQSGGHIAVYSELEHGTSFKIYLPVVTERISSGKSFHGVRTAPKGNETVLLVEDEDGVRGFARHALQMFGYTVLEASNGAEAIKMCEEQKEPIHLVVSDVVMPEMGGRRLIEQLTALRPGIKVLFLSGYTDDAVMRHGVLEAEVAFLQKPFTPTALANKVREVLDRTA